MTNATDRLLIPEFQEYLLADCDVRVLFVEGNTDLEFWRCVVPEELRKNVAIWSIAAVAVPEAVGGEKGRLLQLAKIVLQWSERDRVLFFADADYDRVRGVSCPANVVLTDGRDLESYAFEDAICTGICRTGCALSESQATTISSQLGSTLRPIAYLRLASEEYDWKLPFQETLKDGTLKRFLKANKAGCHLKLENIIDALVNRMASSDLSFDEIRKKVSDAEIRYRQHSDFEILHGKDCIAYFAWRTQIRYDLSCGIISIGRGNFISKVKRHKNISYVEQWCLLAA